MRNVKSVAAMVTVALSGIVSANVMADTLIVNANGYTLNASGKLKRFDAMVFDDQGKVMEIGNARSLRRHYAKAQIVDVAGKTVLPGLIDAHGHVFELGIAASQLSLRSTNSLAEAQAAIAAYAKQYPQHQWILGGEWNQAIWKLGRFPHATEIDSVVQERPVWLRRVDGHAGWANSAALKLAGITRDTLDPQGGKVERDANGEPTGILVDNAMTLMERVLPRHNESELRAALDAAMAQLRSVGLSSVHDAGLGKAEDQLMREYASQGKLTTRVYGMIGGVQGDFDELSKQGPLLNYADDRYALRAVKLYSDGALGSRGAALLAPYSDAPNTKGLLFVSDQEMQAQVKKAVALGYQVNVHAIGDAGNRQVIESLSLVNKDAKSRALRHRIEHAQVLELSDIPRLKSNDIIPSMQPTHATSDMNMAEDRIGKQRLQGAYAWRTFLKQGSRIACGSDFPIESPNPFWGMYSAISRQDFAQKPQGGWHAEQAMSRLEAFRCFTLDAAYAGHQEQILGSLEPGKWADFIVIDRDIFTVPVSEIYKTEVLQTWQAGRQVFRK